MVFMFHALPLPPTNPAHAVLVGSQSIDYYHCVNLAASASGVSTWCGWGGEGSRVDGWLAEPMTMMVVCKGRVPARVLPSREIDRARW